MHLKSYVGENNEVEILMYNHIKVIQNLIRAKTVLFMSPLIL